LWQKRKQVIKKKFKKLTAVLDKHEDMNPYILFVDNEIRYKSDVDKLRADVYGLPFVGYNPKKIKSFNRQVKIYKDIDSKPIKPTYDVWKLYQEKIGRKATNENNKLKYILILGSAREFPEFKIAKNKNILDIMGTDIFSDLHYVYRSEGGYIASIGRLPLEFAYNYSSSPQQFNKKAWIHNADYVCGLGGIYRISYVNKLQRPIWDILEGKSYCPNIKLNSLSENDPDPEEMKVDLKIPSLFVAGWHGNTRRVGAGNKGPELLLTNVHPLIFVSTSCDGSNTGDYEDNKLGNPNDLFSSILLSNGSSYIGNSGYANGEEAPEIVVDFIVSLISEKTNLGDSWLQTIKNFDGSDYSRDQFRLLGDPALDTSALDDPPSNHISTLPPQFSITINASYNETHPITRRRSTAILS
jgi:hypothetical protein